MFFFMLGLPGRFTEWCGALTAALARRAGKPLARIEADTLEKLAAVAIQTGTLQALVTSHQPGGGLRGALVEARCNFLVVLDDSRAALIDLVLCRGLGLTEAVRLLASSCASVTKCSELPGALVLKRDRDRSQPAATAAAIAKQFGIALEDNAIAELLEEFGTVESSFREDDAIAWWDGLDRGQRDMTIRALLPYLDPAAPGTQLPITWTGELFYACNQPGMPGSALIDITGRAHRVIDGPNIMLPAGTWTVTLTLFCTREAAEHELLVEVVIGDRVAAGTARPRAEGDAVLSLDFTIDKLTEHPVAIHISTVRAAFDGAVSVIEATFICTQAAGGPTA